MPLLSLWCRHLGGSYSLADKWQRRPSLELERSGRKHSFTCPIEGLCRWSFEWVSFGVEDPYKKSKQNTCVLWSVTAYSRRDWNCSDRQMSDTWRETQVNYNIHNLQGTNSTYRYFNTSANQKLSWSSILVETTSFTSFNPANPVGVFKNLLKLAIALAARSRYLLSPVTRYA